MASQILGSGYNTDVRMPTIAQCVNNTLVAFNNGIQASLGMTYTNNIANLAASFGLTAWYQYGNPLFQPFSIGAEAEFLNLLKGSMMVQTEIFTQSVTCPTQSIIPAGYGVDALNPYGQGVYENSQTEFRLLCGDQFVSQVNYGANFITAVLLTFADVSSVTNYQAGVHLTAILGLFDYWSNLSGSISSVNNLENIEIVAAQFGGNTADLGPIFQTDNGIYYSTSCNTSTISVCQGVINALSNYSAMTFPSQMNCTSDISQIGYVYQPYTSLGLNATVSLVNQDVISARNQIESITNNQEAMQDAWSSMGSTFSASMNPSILSEIQVVDGNFASNLAMINQKYNVSQACYQQITTCSDIVSQITSGLIPLNMTIVNQFMEGYTFFISGVNINEGNGDWLGWSFSLYPIGDDVFYLKPNGEMPNPIQYSPLLNLSFFGDEAIITGNNNLLTGSESCNVWSFAGNIFDPGYELVSRTTLIPITSPYLPFNDFDV